MRKYDPRSAAQLADELTAEEQAQLLPELEAELKTLGLGLPVYGKVWNILLHPDATPYDPAFFWGPTYIEVCRRAINFMIKEKAPHP